MVAAVALLVACPILYAEECSAYGSVGLLISEVQSTGSEGFSLYNPGGREIDLKGYYLSDGEGKVTFTKSLTLPGCSKISITFDKDADQTFLKRPDEPDIRIFEVNTEGIKAESNFRLADAGDDLYVYSPDGRVLDSVCWGNTIAKGWSGEPAEKPTKDRYLVRSLLIDTDSSEDWRLSRPGMTDRNFGPTFTADVTPFTFPECNGVEIYNALEAAEHEVLLSIYQITSIEVVALLCLLADKGVDVTVLLEGTPLGRGDTVNLERTMMRSIVDSGGKVMMVNDKNSSGDMSNRFLYIHTKYAVIDGHTTIITSENWTDANLSEGDGNRGWGAIIEGDGYASYMRNIFLNDSSDYYGDCNELLYLYPGQLPYEGDLTYSDPGLNYDDSGSSFTFKNCQVSPVLSPDNSYDALRSFIEGAETRVYAEQMDISNSYRGIDERSPISWMVDSASRGVDSKLILDLTFDDGGTAAEIGLINTTTDLRAAGIEGGPGFSLTHNKGVIADDSVWIGSVNWTDTSFFRNREAAVIIRSQEISDHYAEYFMADWNYNDRTQGMDVNILSADTDLHAGFGYFEADVFPRGNYTYEWDLYGDGRLVRHSVIHKIAYEGLEPGRHVLALTVSDEDSGRRSISYLEYTVVEDEEGNDIIYTKYSIYLIVGAVATLLIANSLRNHRSSDSRNEQRKRYR